MPSTSHLLPYSVRCGFERHFLAPPLTYSVLCELLHKRDLKRIAESTVRRLSLYLSFLEGIERQGLKTISSDELASLGGTTSAQVRKDLSLFGSFGKRGLGYSVPELSGKLRGILGLGKQWRVVIIGAGKIGAALARYRGFAERGFNVTAVYDSDETKIGKKWENLTVRAIADLEKDAAKQDFDIAVVAIPAEGAPAVVKQVVRAGIKAILNFAPVQLSVPADVTVRDVNMAMELEGLSFALSNRGE
ncbi:MAG: redox-sensing transcriptional repressor [Gemmatimonadaceae bacterium]|nr:redox-sensing transcriptional repressor [Gemmatimonadaceae bacterium]